MKRLAIRVWAFLSGGWLVYVFDREDECSTPARTKNGVVRAFGRTLQINSAGKTDDPRYQWWVPPARRR
jgi:hypothetical protein